MHFQFAVLMLILWATGVITGVLIAGALEWRHIERSRLQGNAEARWRAAE